MIGIGMVVDGAEARITVTHTADIHAKHGDATRSPFARQLHVSSSRSDRVHGACVDENDAGFAASAVALAENAEKTIVAERRGALGDPVLDRTRDETKVAGVSTNR